MTTELDPEFSKQIEEVIKGNVGELSFGEAFDFLQEVVIPLVDSGITFTAESVEKQVSMWEKSYPGSKVELPIVAVMLADLGLEKEKESWFRAAFSLRDISLDLGQESLTTWSNSLWDEFTDSI